MGTTALIAGITSPITRAWIAAEGVGMSEVADWSSEKSEWYMK